jgi:hypothetical protein
MNAEKLVEQLKILDAIIRSNENYLILHQYVNTIKKKEGQIFNVLTEDGVYNLKLSLNRMRTGKETNVKDNRVSPPVVMDILNQLTGDYSLLSGLDNNEWVDLVVYLYDSSLRALKPTQRKVETSQSVVGKNHISVYLDCPWVITLMLLEIVDCINR